MKNDSSSFHLLVLIQGRRNILKSKYSPKSTTKKAKKVIQNEMKYYYGGDDYGNRASKDYIENMKRDAEACADNRSIYGDWNKGKELVNAGCFACYYSDQRKMLNKIYGKRTVDKWDGHKVHETYGNLIGREYASELRKRRKKENKE